MLDPVTVSVLTHRFEAIVQEMGEAMLRTAYSQILNSSRDFSTAICDGQARLVAQAEHVPIHVGAIPWAVESVDRKSTRLNSSHGYISYAVFCSKKKSTATARCGVMAAAATSAQNCRRGTGISVLNISSPRHPIRE